MVLKCCICECLIFPSIKCEPNEHTDYVYCSKCNIEDATNEQWQKFQVTANKYVYNNFKVMIQMTKPIKTVPVIVKPKTWEEQFGDRYSKIDI